MSTKVKEPKQYSAPYLTRMPNGQIKYSNPYSITRVQESCGHPGPNGMKEWTARTEKPERFIERLSKEVLKNDRQMNAGQPYTPRYAGMVMASGGWKTVVLDGHRLLMEPAGEDVQKVPLPEFDFTENTQGAKFKCCTIHDPEFHLAIKRALVAADKRSNKVTLEFRSDSFLDGNSGMVRVRSENGNGYRNEGIEFDQEVPAECGFDGQVVLNGRYLESMCGIWPLKVWWQGKDAYMVLGDEQDRFRVALMSMRG